MIFLDKVYGQHDVADLVILELIASPAFQRLRGICQKGLQGEYTRFDHSLGTMLLLRMLGATLEEQVAGLTHDVSHTAFSHLVDLITGTAQKDDLQDRTHATFIRDRTGFVEIVKRYGLPEVCVLEPHRHGLLERPIPELCADRVDYTLRDCAALGFKNVVETCVPALIAHKGKIIFNSRHAALVFWQAYYTKENRESTPQFMAPYELLADAFRRAFKIGAMGLNTCTRRINMLLKDCGV